MLDREKLKKDLKVIQDNAWKVEANTTINAMVTHIVSEVLDKVLLPELETLEAKLLETQVDLLNAEGNIEYLTDTVSTLKEHKENGSTNGRATNAKRNAKAPGKVTNGQAEEARASLS